MSTKSGKKKKDYAPMVVFKAKTKVPTSVNLTIKKNIGFKKKECKFEKVKEIVSRGVRKKPVAIFVVEYNGEIIGGIAAPPNSCFTIAKGAFGSEMLSKSSNKGAFKSEGSTSSEELLHLYNPCVRLPTGAWW